MGDHTGTGSDRARGVMSIQPLLRLVATRPHLLVDHVDAYAALVDEEISVAVSDWKRRTLLNAVALSLLAVGGMLGGVALMLDAVVSTPSRENGWVLVVVPAIPIVVALLCLIARARSRQHAFSDVRQQLAADLKMLREVCSPERATTS